MIDLTPEELAFASGGKLVGGPAQPQDPQDVPARAVVDTRELKPGDLFFGLRGERADGGSFAEQALRNGAWGVVIEGGHAKGLLGRGLEGRIFAVADPLAALARLATEWRRRLSGGDCTVIGITGSVGKTSTRDILVAMLKPLRKVHASPRNYNTEVGLPLAMLAAEPDTDCLILEMAMRGPGQIRRLAKIALPDIGLITAIGEVHLEQMGSIEAIAEAKAELIAELPAGGICVVPAATEMLRPHMRSGIHTITFADDSEHDSDGALEHAAQVAEGTAQVRLQGYRVEGSHTIALFAVGAKRFELEFNFTHRHNLVNATAAVAVTSALRAPHDKLAQGARQVQFSRLRGEQLELPGGIAVINDCYNASPVSMRAAIDHLADVASRRGSGRRVAVLGEMAELGPDAALHHRRIGAYAARRNVDRLVAVGDLARHYLDGVDATVEAWHVEDVARAAEVVADLLRPNDAVLLKASRSVELERVAEALIEIKGVG